MNDAQLQAKLAELLALPHETEWAEFKHNNSDPQMIGEYLSAISNSAALESQPFGYIVWGVEDGTHHVVGTSFKPRTQKGAGNEDLEPWLNKLLSPRINFRIFEFEADGNPVVLFEVQAANTAPVAFSGRRYVRVGSHKKLLGEHPERERKLWGIVSGPVVDWSAGICEAATLDDLAPDAIQKARSEYAERFEGDPKKSHLAKEVWQWDDATFLNKIKVAIDGRLTRAALILLGRIIVVEQPDSLLCTNLGAFYPGSVEEVVVRDSPQEFSANPLLAQAMVSLNMIDTLGSGIKRTFQIQRDRNFPMPTYDLSEPERVKVRLIGQILDPNYTRMLMSQTNLELLDVIALDKVQKQVPISDEELKSLRAKKLVEGRRRNLFVSSAVAAATHAKADYIRNRAFDKDHYEKMVVTYLEKFGEATRQDLDQLLTPKLSDALDDGQKKNFINNLLQDMRREGTLVVEGTTRWAKWRLT